MISYVKGQLVEVFNDTIVVENNGIGFNIKVPATVISHFSKIGEPVKVYTYLQIREESHSLFGFLTRDDLNIFKMLINVNGIGPKGALAILSTISPNDLRFAVISGDVKLISSAPGIGSKTAQKLIIELKDKVSLEDALENTLYESGSTGSDSEAQNEAIEALCALGYGSAQAVRAVRQVEDIESKDSEVILKEALKKLATL
ncbi:MAG: Holliday junction branch migration protein RuvA [Lachnospira sp.]|jgi:Holliday junction DNA helicase RuvA|nr:Holliday junction branch migration protein RuvA [Lachnospira sp.]